MTEKIFDDCSSVAMCKSRWPKIESHPWEVLEFHQDKTCFFRKNINQYIYTYIYIDRCDYLYIYIQIDVTYIFINIYIYIYVTDIRVHNPNTFCNPQWGMVFID